jgi:hypothetical protein
LGRRAITSVNSQRSGPVVLEVPRWFHRRRGAREALRGKIREFLSQGRRTFVVSVIDPGRFVSMDIGVLLGVASLVREAGGILTIATENEKFHAIPHPSIEEGLLRFRNVDDARQYIEERESARRDT